MSLLFRPRALESIDFESLFRTLDVTESGYVDLDEYLASLLAVCQNNSAHDRQLLIKCEKMIREDKHGDLLRPTSTAPKSGSVRAAESPAPAAPAALAGSPGPDRPASRPRSGAPWSKAKPGLQADEASALGSRVAAVEATVAAVSTYVFSEFF